MDPALELEIIRLRTDEGWPDPPRGAASIADEQKLYQRYLENRFRKAFDLDGVPIRLRFRAKRRRRGRS